MSQKNSGKGKMSLRHLCGLFFGNDNGFEAIFFNVGNRVSSKSSVFFKAYASIRTGEYPMTFSNETFAQRPAMILAR